MPITPESEPTAFAKAAAAAVRHLLVDLRHSQADLARGTTMSANYIAERLRDEKSFTLSDIEEIGRFFGIDPEQLLVEASRASRDVGALTDTDALDEIPVLTADELAKRDLGKAALHGPDVTDQEDDDADDAGPRA